jgi:hypothetical protein
MPNTPHNDPKSGQDPSRQHEDQSRHGQDQPNRQSKGGGGPNNPLPGEPGGPTSGYSDEDRKAAEEGQQHARDDKDKGGAAGQKR